MQDATVTGYRLDAVHTFRVRTLASLGYGTRVALGNASGSRSDWATPFRVDVSITDATRRRELVAEGVARVEPGERRVFDCAPFVGDRESDVEVVFHLVPERLLPRAEGGVVELERAQLYFYLTAQDHFVEYYRPDGFSAGVLYQSGAFNYPLFSKEHTTLIQAPKCYVSEELDTLVSLVNSSADPEWNTSAIVRCALLTERGSLAAAWTETLPPFGLALVSLRERLRMEGVSVGTLARFYCFHAVCGEATLLPITINRHGSTGAIGLEHSLPPIYYSNEARGALRARALGGFDRMVARARSTP